MLACRGDIVGKLLLVLVLFGRYLCSIHKRVGVVRSFRPNYGP